ncbi:MAG: hypothetical protein MJY54_02330, partial [archaeon]|nr:hypothetical protein [archaeon]
YVALKVNIDNLLSQLNLRKYEFCSQGVSCNPLDKSLYKIVPNDAGVYEAFKAIDCSDVKFNMLEYNHITVRSDLGAKQKILSCLYKDFESKRRELENKGFKKIADYARFLFNKLARHNNAVVEDMKNSEKIKLCDVCYRVYITTVLIYEYISNEECIKQFKEFCSAERES